MSTEDATTGVRATLRLTTRCVNRCIFCAQDGLPHDDADEPESTLCALRRSADEITFTGGEPSTAARLVELVAQARTLGFRKIGLQTNAAGFAGVKLVEQVVEAGLTDAHLSIHGGTAAVHDYHTGREGSFSALHDAAARLRRLGVELVATTVLTRSNFRVLASIPPLLTRMGIAAWAVTLPVTAGRAADRFDRVVPRLGLALPFALHTLASARALGIPVALVGAPLCALGPNDALVLPSAPRTFAEPCASCGVRQRCVGVDAAYLERFGVEELRPRESASATAPPIPPRLARMFVGIGELVQRELSLPPPPARVRGSLPILGKARPAVGEARGRAAAQTGSDLRELFPGLFDAED